MIFWTLLQLLDQCAISPVIVHTTETQFEHEYAAVEDTVNAIHRYEEPPGEESY